MSKTISRKDETLIAALLSNSTVRAAAKTVNRSETQVYARLRDPLFRARYDEARHELLEQSTAALQGRLSAAVETMTEIMQDTDATHQTRLNAAEAIVRNSLKLTELTDILERLDRLEEREGKYV